MFLQLEVKITSHCQH